MTVHHSPADAAPAVLHFWFDEIDPERWFAKSAALDAEIARRFAALRDAVVADRAAEWRSDPDHLLAAILLVDQFSRNIHRGTAAAFAADPLALELTGIALRNDWHARMTLARRQFVLMPLMHSETLSDQRRALEEYGRLGDPLVFDFAKRHHDQVERFGRFPGRNAALGRRSTPDEQSALDAGAAF